MYYRKLTPEPITYIKLNLPAKLLRNTRFKNIIARYGLIQKQFVKSLITNKRTLV